ISQPRSRISWLLQLSLIRQSGSQFMLVDCPRENEVRPPGPSAHTACTSKHTFRGAMGLFSTSLSRTWTNRASPTSDVDWIGMAFPPKSTVVVPDESLNINPLTSGSSIKNVTKLLSEFPTLRNW